MIKELLYDYGKENFEKFNKELIYDMRKESLVDYILDVAQSIVDSPFCNRIVSWSLETDENKFETTKIVYPTKRNEKRQSKGDITMSIEPSRLDKLTIVYELEYEGEKETLEQVLFLPKVKDKFYYYIDGNRCYPLYQIVDSSTYSRENSLILKSVGRTRIVLERIYQNFTTIYGITHRAPIFMSKLFNKQCSILLYLFAGKGFNETIRYMELDDVIAIRDSINDASKNYYFSILDDSKYLEVNKFIFTQDEFTRSFVKMLIDVLTYDKKKRKKDEIDYLNTNYWITRLGSVFTTNQDDNFVFNKGMSVLVSFNRLCDNTTRKSLKLMDHNKKDTYALVRWMMRNFNNLIQKNNLDISTKRIRLGEYLANYYAVKLSNNIYRLLDTSKKFMTMKKIKAAIQVTPSLLINYIGKSPLIRYDNNVNDMDVFIALQYSLKGPGGLGESNPNSVPSIYRRIHPSHVKYKLDINSSGTSDPGMSGNLTPMCKPIDGYFDPTPEVQDYEFNLQRLKMVYKTLNDKVGIQNINRIVEDFADYDENGLMTFIPVSQRTSYDYTDDELAKLYLTLREKAFKYEFEVLEGLLDNRDAIVVKDDNGRIDPFVQLIENEYGESMEVVQLL